MIEVELRGLEVFGHHGVTEEEQKRGQTLLWDVAYRVAEPSRDDLSETVDYDAVAQCVKEVSDGRRFQLLEFLAAAVADELVERFRVESVRVRVCKRELELPVEHTAATATRP
ncbi:MAG: dihydroneopterin aldolase [Actinobacteria bacterium]|nr:dihydroneopterin aldolase [Actinomycetota bacterium]